MNENKDAIRIFQGEEMRSVWDETEKKWLYSVVDIIRILTGSENPSAYWRKLKQRLKDENNESVTNCHGLRMPLLTVRCV